METIFENFQEIPLTINYIKQLHGELLQYSEKDMRHRGEYKTLSNSVEAFSPEGESIGVIFKTATPFDTPRLMEELITWADNTLTEKMLTHCLSLLYSLWFFWKYTHFKMVMEDCPVF